MKTSNDYCIILAGGMGKRLWPCSRRNRPKQFIDFFGTGQTLLQHTYHRIVRFIPPGNIYISTFSDYEELVREQLPDLPAENILAEPVQLSTAPATAWVSYHIAQANPEANILISPCDQMIVDENRFAEQIGRGLRFVEQNDAFLAMAVRADRPNTGYGYIQMGEAVGEDRYTVQSFTEKPGEDYARLFVESGEFLWNTGLFLWNSRAIKQLMNSVMPMVTEMLSATPAAELTAEREMEIVRRYYPAIARRSIDLVVLEKGQKVFVQVCNFGWADIGSWPELHEVQRQDADGNAVVGDASRVMFSASRNNLVCVPGGMAAVVHGLEGYLVAADRNVVVVCPNDDPEVVKKLFNEAQVTLGPDFV